MHQLVQQRLDQVAFRHAEHRTGDGIVEPAERRVGGHRDLADVQPALAQPRGLGVGARHVEVPLVGHAAYDRKPEARRVDLARPRGHHSGDDAIAGPGRVLGVALADVQTEPGGEVADACDAREALAQRLGCVGVGEQGLDRLACEEQARLTRADVGQIAAGEEPGAAGGERAERVPRDRAARARPRDGERALAEAYAAGAVGCEDAKTRTASPGCSTPRTPLADAVRAAALRARRGRVSPSTRRARARHRLVGGVEGGARADRDSERLAVRPSFTPFAAGAASRCWAGSRAGVRHRCPRVHAPRAGAGGGRARPH